MTNSTIQKTNLPTVSVIVPTYNRAQILAETINAILKQTYRDFELIIISDGSNDGTSDKARQYQNIDQRVRYYEISHTGRPAPARNYGIKKARGEFLAFCDDDDIWMPQKLEKQIRTMRQRPEFGLCYTYRITKTANSEHIFPYKFRAGNVFKKLFTSTNFITNSSVLIRSSILRNLELRGGIFDELPKMKAIEDYDLWIRIAQNYPVACVPEPLVICQYDENSVWHQNPFNILKYYFYYRKGVGIKLFFEKLMYFPLNRLYFLIKHKLAVKMYKKIKQALGILSEIFIRTRFFQTNIFSGTTSAAETRRALRTLLDGKLVNGSDIDIYENAFAKYFGTAKSFSFSTGRMALYAILKTLNVGHGDEVIIPAFTCVVVANAIIYTGAKPIYCDIESERFSSDPRDIEAKITLRTKAIIAQHTFGIPCLIDEIIELGKKYNIPVIEDCAHALGGKNKGQMLGTIGYASFFSTDHTKVISTGIGGLATSVNQECLEKLEKIHKESKFLSSWQIRRQILTFLIFHYLTHPRAYWIFKPFLPFLIKTKIAMFITDYLKLTKPTSYPFPARLSNAHAEIGLSQLNNLTKNLVSRKKTAAEFKEIIGANEKIFKNNEIDCVWLRYPILIENREDFVNDLKKYYDFGVWFTTIAGCRSSNFSEIGYDEGSCPTAERIIKQIVSIPTHGRVRPLYILINALRNLKKTTRATFIYERRK